MDYDNDFEEGFVHTSLGKIFFKRHRADGKKLIFLHGLGGTTKVWSKLVRFLPNEFDVSLLDLLGHGRSDAPEITYRVSEQVQVLNEFIADQNNGSSAIVGHSYGGWVAALYASYPYPANCFVLASCAGLREDVELYGEQKHEEIKQLVMLNNQERVMHSILDSFGEERLDEQVLSRIKKPTLLIWGDKDNVVEAKWASVFNKQIKNSTLKIIPGAAHNPHYSNPQEFAKLLLEFV